MSEALVYALGIAVSPVAIAAILLLGVLIGALVLADGLDGV